MFREEIIRNLYVSFFLFESHKDVNIICNVRRVTRVREIGKNDSVREFFEILSRSFSFFFSLWLFRGAHISCNSSTLAVLLIDTHLGPIKSIMRLIRPGRSSLREEQSEKMRWDYDRRVVGIFRVASPIIIIREEKSGEKQLMVEAARRCTFLGRLTCSLLQILANIVAKTDISIRRMNRLRIIDLMLI